jgi:hypothetical protein
MLYNSDNAPILSAASVIFADAPPDDDVFSVLFCLIGTL